MTIEWLIYVRQSDLIITWRFFHSWNTQPDQWAVGCLTPQESYVENRLLGQLLAKVCNIHNFMVKKWSVWCSIPHGIDCVWLIEFLTLQISNLFIWYYHRILVITATNRNGQNLNGHKPKRPQTGTATDRNGHKPKRPQTGTATNRNGHKPKRPQTGAATNRNGHKPERPQIKIDTTISDSAGYKSVCSI